MKPIGSVPGASAIARRDTALSACGSGGGSSTTLVGAGNMSARSRIRTAIGSAVPDGTVWTS